MKHAGPERTYYDYAGVIHLGPPGKPVSASLAELAILWAGKWVCSDCFGYRDGKHLPTISSTVTGNPWLPIPIPPLGLPW